MQSAVELLGRRIPRESDAYQHGARRSGVAHAPCDVKQYGCQRRAPIIEPGIVIEGVGRVVYFTPGASSAVENTSPTGTAAVAWMPTEMRKSVTFSKWGRVRRHYDSKAHHRAPASPCQVWGRVQNLPLQAHGSRDGASPSSIDTQQTHLEELQSRRKWRLSTAASPRQAVRRCSRRRKTAAAADGAK